MSENKNIYQKIFDAKKFVATQPIKKKGYNKYSDYSYYKPDQVDELALLAFEKVKIDAHFQLLKDELGHYGCLTIVNLENLQEKMELVFRTDIPSIKATNITQQYGGAVTTTRRYLLQNLLSIFDAELDFDDPNSPIAPTNPKNLANNTPSNGNGNKQQSDKEYISEAQRKRLFAITKKCNVPSEKVKEILKSFNTNSSLDIRKSDYDAIIAKVEELKQ